MLLKNISQIKSISSKLGSIEVFSFQFINLNLIKSTVGESWEKLRTKIFDVSAHFLEKRLKQDDVLIRTHTGFLIVFAEELDEDAHIIGKTLSDEINAFFLGDGSVEGVEVQASHKTVTAEELDDTIEFLDHPIETPSNTPAPPPAEVAPAPLALSEPPPTPDAEQIADVDIAKDVSLYFRPIWDSKRQIVSSNTCMPCLDTTVFHLYGRDITLGEEDSADDFELDMHMLASCQEKICQPTTLKVPLVITVTVSYNTLESKKLRLPYFSALAKTPEKYRKFMIVCVDQIPVGVPNNKLIDTLRPLRPFCSALVIHQLPRSMVHSSFHECGIALFGFSLRDYLSHSKILTKKHIEEIAAFCTKVQQLNATVYVTEVDHIEHLVPLKNAGVRYYEGVCIKEQELVPMALSTLSAKDIFQAQRKAVA